MIRAGTFPGRKPWTRTCPATRLYAASRLGLSSSNGTSTVSRTRVGLRVSTALVTGHALLAGGWGGHSSRPSAAPGRLPARDRWLRNPGVALHHERQVAGVVRPAGGPRLA